MPDENQNRVAHMFQINVTPDGNFSYEPSEDWKYGRSDHICFKCNVPFTIEFLPISGVLTEPSLDTDHPNGITALKEVETNKFAAHADVPTRERPPDPGNPPIRLFQYRITAMIDDKEIARTGKNGSDIC